MSTIAYFLRKNMPVDCYEHDKAEIEKVLHEAGFTFDTSGNGHVMCWHVSDGSCYIDEDGEQSPITFNINLKAHCEDRVEYLGESYTPNIYFDCFGSYGSDIGGEPAPDGCGLLLRFLHKYFEYYPDAYFKIEDCYSKTYIDEKFESGNWTGLF